jgi:hypothetical protein
MQVFKYIVPIAIVVLIYMLAHGRQFFHEYPFIVGFVSSVVASVLINWIAVLEIDEHNKHLHANI